MSLLAPSRRAGVCKASLAALSGLLLFCAAPGESFAAPALAWIAIAPLLAACRTASSAGQAARLGLIAGLFHFIPLLYWITIVLGVYGQTPWFVSVPALLLLAAYMSLFPAGFAALCHWLWPRQSLLFLGPAIWVAGDWLRSFLFTGFPWQDLGYSQYRHPLLLQLADLAGHHGLSWLIALSSFCVFFLLIERQPVAGMKSARPSRPALAFACLLLIANPLYGLARLNQIDQEAAQAEHLGVTVVQGNIDQSQKWRPENVRRTLDTYFRLTEESLASRPAAASELVIWPETALPFSPAEAPELADEVSGFADRLGIWLLAGLPEVQFERGKNVTIFNRAALVTPDGLDGGHYDKQHLVPFGEYVPARKLLPFLSPVVETMADFTPGPEAAPISCQNARLGVLICIESIYPELARGQARRGANLLVNITNDAWFGRSSAPHQHFSMAVLRAVENRKSLARAANTGISGFIDPAGRTLAASPLFTEYTQHAQIPLLTGRTVFNLFGYLFAPGCALMAIFATVRAMTRKKAA